MCELIRIISSCGGVIFRFLLRWLIEKLLQLIMEGGSFGANKTKKFSLVLWYRTFFLLLEINII